VKITNDNAATAVADPETEEHVRATKERQRAADWAAIDRLRERNADKDPEHVLADVTSAVEEVRQKLYEEEQRRQAEGRR
jgi:hypothetical protein